MISKLTEFSYGYAVTEEFVQKWRPLLRTAPLFLSLLDEGKTGGGFDLGLTPVGIPYFLQFKLSERMTGSNSREAKTGKISPPYYRFFLRTEPESAQHDMLVKLDNGKNIVRYVAPLFSNLDEFDAIYNAKQVLANSAFFMPRKIGPFSDRERHTVSFKDRGSRLVLSDPRIDEDPADDETFARTLSAQIHERGSSALTLPSLVDLRSECLGILREHGRSIFVIGRQDNALTVLRDIGYVSRVYFGAELMIALPPITP